MKRLLLAACLAFAACGGTALEPDAGASDAGTADAGTMLTAFQREAIDAHNAVRSTATPTPAPALPPVTWSTTAATQAADWAARCDFTHRDPNTLGENLSAATNERAITTIVNDWASERSDYDYAANRCAIGASCGHYTQVVWRSSTGLGCATQRCTTGSPFGTGAWFFTVCNYDPAGNFVGQKPY